MELCSEKPSNTYQNEAINQHFFLPAALATTTQTNISLKSITYSHQILDPQLHKLHVLHLHDATLEHRHIQLLQHARNVLTRRLPLVQELQQRLRLRVQRHLRVEVLNQLVLVADVVHDRRTERHALAALRHQTLREVRSPDVRDAAVHRHRQQHAPEVLVLEQRRLRVPRRVRFLPQNHAVLDRLVEGRRNCRRDAVDGVQVGIHVLQVLDDGRITDSQGRTVDFKNTILIMTSNIGSSYLLDGIDENGDIKPDAEAMVMNDLRAHFRPEFLNRLDETIMFRPLTKDNVYSIISLLVNDINKRLADKELRIELTEAAKQLVVEGGYDPTYGARPLKRYLQKNVETEAAKLILEGNVGSGDTILIDNVDGKLTARIKQHLREV